MNQPTPGAPRARDRGSISRRRRRPTVPEPLESRRLLTVPALVGGVVAGVTDPQALGVLNGAVYYSLESPSTQAADQLWVIRSPGTAPVMIKNVSSGTSAGEIQSPFVDVGNRLLFVVYNTDEGEAQLWSTDGTSAGTVDLDAFGSNGDLDLSDSVLYNGALYLGYSLAQNGPTAADLLKTDGTKAGTSVVESWSNGTQISDFNVVNGKLLYNLNLGRGSDTELYAGNGTAVGSSVILSYASSYASDLTNAGSRLFFDGTVEVEDGSELMNTGLWVTDGTASGTHNISPIVPGSLTAFDGDVYFAANDGTHGSELWKSDGTSSGTVMVADLDPGSASSNPTDLTLVGNTLYFVAQDAKDGYQLFKSDGTTAGTSMVKIVDPGNTSAIAIDNLTNLGGNLFFVVGGTTPWISDGTAADTVAIPLRGADVPLSSILDPTPTGDGGIVLNGIAPVTIAGTPVTTRILRISTASVAAANPDDFDGDGTPDLAVYGKDPKDGKYDFRILTSSTGFSASKEVIFDNHGYGFGNAGSIPVPGDYFGDGKAAYALWTPNGSGGMTFTAISSVTGKSVTVTFGTPTDVPVVADFDGDGKADFGVFGKDPKDGKYDFRVLTAASGFNPADAITFDNNGYGFGNAASIPVVGDFDGKGHADYGLFNPSSNGSTFTYIDPVTKSSVTKTIGTANDSATAVDFDGDGKSDLVLFGPDPSKSGHYRYEVLTSSSGFNPASAVIFNNFGYGYGNASSTPAIADYQGDDLPDFALFTTDGKGGMEYVYQTGQVGQGVTVDGFASTDISLASPTYLRARKVRGS